MRPKKTRWICCPPGDRCFRPRGVPSHKLEGIVLSLDEMEAVRLADLEELEQEKVARRMRIHRSTVSRILASARKKIGDALVNCKALRVEGGCCKVVKQRNVK